MKARALIFLVLALVACFATIYVARAWLSTQRAETAALGKSDNPARYVLVAAKNLPTGNFIRPGDLRWQSWPQGAMDDNYLHQDKDKLDSLVGSVARQNIAAGEPVTNGRVIKPGDRGFLAAVLAPGLRAVSVPVTATSGVAGLVFPGDRVDLILSHQVKDDRNPNAPAKVASETVLSEIRVLAVDQLTANQDNKPLLAKTMTFEVTPKQVEVIGVASSLGNLSLSLRGLAMNGDDGKPSLQKKGPVSHTIDSEVSALIFHHDPNAGPLITVLRGDFGSAAAAHKEVPVSAASAGAGS